MEAAVLPQQVQELDALLGAMVAFHCKAARVAEVPTVPTTEAVALTESTVVLVPTSEAAVVVEEVSTAAEEEEAASLTLAPAAAAGPHG